MTLAVTVSGGQGGHSGSGIALGRSNAIKVLGRALREAHATVPFRLVSLDGGKSRNAIPRDAVALVSVPADREARAPRRDRRRRTRRSATRSRRRTPASRSTVASAEPSVDPWSDETTERLLDAIALVPTGPLALSPDFDDLVETSTSLGEAITEGDRLTLHSLSRSSNDSAMPDVIATLDAAGRLGGRHARGEVQLRRVAAGPRIARARGRQGRLRAPVRRAADRHGRARRARDRGDRRQGRPSPRHAVVRAADRVPALAGRAGEHSDRRAVLAAAGGIRGRAVETGRVVMTDRGPLVWIAVVAVGIVAVIGIAALIGDDNSDETVAAGEWAQSVCGTVAVWRGELEAIVEDIRTPTSAGSGSEEPQSETPQGRTGFIRHGLERAIQATETMVEGVDNAGTPDTEQGEDVAELVSELGGLGRRRARGRRGLARRGGRLPRGRRSSSSREQRGRSARCWHPARRPSPTSREPTPSSRPRCATRVPARSCGRRRAR